MDPDAAVLVLRRGRDRADDGCTAPHSIADGEGSFQIQLFWLGAGMLNLFPHALCPYAYLLRRTLVSSKWKCPM